MENVDEFIQPTAHDENLIEDLPTESTVCSEDETNGSNPGNEKAITIEALTKAYQSLTDKLDDENAVPSDEKFKTELFENALNAELTPEFILKSFLFDRAMNAAYLRGRNEKIENLKSDTSLRLDNPEDIQTVKKRKIEFLSRTKTSIWDM